MEHDISNFARETVRLLSDSAELFKLHWGAKNYYQHLASQLPRIIASNETMLAACPGGIERSAVFNSNIGLAGVLVPQIDYSTIAPELNHLVRHAAGSKGIPLPFLMHMLLDSEQTENGIRIPGFNMEVNHLVLIVSLQEFDPQLNGRTLLTIGKALGAANKSRCSLDLVIEEDVDIHANYLTQTIVAEIARQEQAALKRQSLLGGLGKGLISRLIKKLSDI